MHLRHLEIFHAIMSSHSLTEAARRLNISQPAVSTMLKHMEAQLGLVLFDRIGGRLHPTPEAEALFGDADGIFARLATFRRLAQTLRDGKSGQLSVVVAPTLADGLLPTVVAQFRETRPNVILQVRSLPTGQVAERVARREADLGVAYGLVSSTGLEVTAIGSSRVACIMHPTHPLAALPVVTPADLVGHDIVSYEADTPIGRLIRRCFREVGARLSVKIEVSISLTACFIAQQATALALVDHMMPLSGAFPDLVIRPFQPEIKFDIALLFPSDRPRSRLAHQFAEIVRSVAAR